MIKPGSLTGLCASSSPEASPGAERSWGATSARCLLEGGQRAKSPPAAEDDHGPKQTELPVRRSLFALGPLPPSCAGKRGGLPAATRPPRPPADVTHPDLSKKPGCGGKIGSGAGLWTEALFSQGDSITESAPVSQLYPASAPVSRWGFALGECSAELSTCESAPESALLAHFSPAPVSVFSREGLEQRFPEKPPFN